MSACRAMNEGSSGRSFSLVIRRTREFVIGAEVDPWLVEGDENRGQIESPIRRL